MRRPVGVMVLVLVSSVGCVTAPPPKPKEAAEQAFTTAPEVEQRVAVRLQDSPEKWAREFHRSGECEYAARELIASNGRDTGWKYLKGCATRPDFGILAPLLDHWGNDFKTRPDAPPIMAQVLANRGGSLGPDLALLQERRMPIFSVASALRQPQAFAGRYVVFVGKIEKVRAHKGQAEMVVAEQSRGTDQGVVFVGPTAGSVSSSSGSSSGSGRYSTSGVLGSGSGSYSASSSRTSGTREGMLEQRETFEFSDTGRSIFVRLAKADPYLSTEHDYLFLVRFDGAKKGDVDQSSDEDPVLIPLVTLVSYHEVSASGVISR